MHKHAITYFCLVLAQIFAFSVMHYTGSDICTRCMCGLGTRLVRKQANMHQMWSGVISVGKHANTN